MTREPPPVRDDCCVDPRIATHFDASNRSRSAGGSLPEMGAVTQRLYGQLRDAKELHPTVLELGCGSGALTVGLLQLGADRARGIDLSTEAISTAGRRAEAAGVSDRVRFEVGDGAQAPLSKSDWVILDRVMCCYPDVDRLLGNAISAARSRVVFSVPNSRGWRGVVTRIVIPLEFIVTTLQRIPCRAYVHSLDVIEGTLRAEGFSLRSHTIGLWYTAVWERPVAA